MTAHSTQGWPAVPSEGDRDMDKLQTHEQDRHACEAQGDQLERSLAFPWI